MDAKRMRTMAEAEAEEAAEELREAKMRSRSRSRSTDGFYSKRWSKSRPKRPLPEPGSARSGIPPGEAVTHNGNFHLDDVASAAVLGRIGWAVAREARRSSFRNGGVPRPGVLYFDTGGVYDPGRLLFDHHLDRAMVGPSGAVMSAISLLWPVFGREYVEAVLPDADEAQLEYARRRVGRVFDDLDVHSSRLFKRNERLPMLGTVASMVSAFVPMDADEEEMERSFRAAVSWLGAYLEAAVRNAARRCAVLGRLMRHLRTNDGWKAGVLVLSEFAPFGEALDAMAIEGQLEAVSRVRYVVYPSADGNFHVVPYRHGDRAGRSFPKTWAAAGRSADRLRLASGTMSAEYLSPDGGLGVASDMRGAVVMALNAIRYDETGQMPQMDNWSPPERKVAEVELPGPEDGSQPGPAPEEIEAEVEEASPPPARRSPLAGAHWKTEAPRGRVGGPIGVLDSKAGRRSAERRRPVEPGKSGAAPAPTENRGLIEADGPVVTDIIELARWPVLTETVELERLEPTKGNIYDV